MAVLNIKAYPRITQDSGNLYCYLTMQAVEWVSLPTIQQLFQFGSPQDPTATPYPVFPDFDAALAYYQSSMATTLMATVNTLAANLYVSYDVEKVEPAVAVLVDSLTFDNIDDGATNKAFTVTEKTKLSGLAAQVQTDWAASSGIGAVLNKPTIPSIITGSHINDAAINAATNAPTSLNVLTTLLGSLTGEVNATNTKQNDLATKYNDLAVRFNTLLDRLEANSLLAAS